MRLSAEVERERESEIAALNLELEQGLAQLSEENGSEVAALSARLSAEEDANRRAQVEIAELRRQLGDEAATSRRAEQLAEQVSHEVDDLRGMVSKAERLKRDLRLADARAEAAERSCTKADKHSIVYGAGAMQGGPRRAGRDHIGPWNGLVASFERVLEYSSSASWR